MSLGLRVTVVALGALALLISILALSGVPALQALGTLGSAVLGSIAALTILVGLCVRCVKKHGAKTAQDQNAQSRFTFVDHRGKGTYHSYGSIEGADKTTTYGSLENFLASTQPEDQAVCNRLKEELKISDLKNRFVENFGNKKVVIALTVKCENQIRNDELIFQLLKLIYLSESELLSLPLEEIKAYDHDQMNILSLRLAQVMPLPQNAAGTLGAFLRYSNEILSEEMSTIFYALFTKEQVILFLNNVNEVDGELVKALFPVSEYQPFIATRSILLLSELDIKYVNQVLPFLNGKALELLMLIRGEQLDYSLITNDQVNELLPCNLTTQDYSTKKMEKLSIEILNGLLPNMNGQLHLIPIKHLKNCKLNLQSLSTDQLKSLFPTSFTEKEVVQQRMSLLHIEVLNQILPNMTSEQLKLIPDNHLKNKGLNLNDLPPEKLKGMFPLSFLEEENTKKRLGRLHSSNHNAVKTILGVK